MKSVFIFFLSLFMYFQASAQLFVNTSNSVFDSIILQKVDTTANEYFKAILDYKSFSQKLVCEIYFGQPKGIFQRKNKLRNEENEVLKFHSDVEFMNLMYKNGWEFSFAMRNAYLFRRIREK